MLFPRASGILLHPTSLPGRYGIGDLGEWAYRFVDYLANTNQTLWQILPLGPTSYGDSPYQCLSTFAGNPNLISLDKLVGMGWLSHEDVATVPDFPADRVDFGPVIDYHNQMLQRAYQNFVAYGAAEHKAAFHQWAESQVNWLPDFTLFAALKNSYGGRSWVEWDQGDALRDPAALQAARARLAAEIEEQAFRQWVFFSHWLELKGYANSKGIRLIGDIPIFVAHDSSDVWANASQFLLEPDGRPTFVAGVPPDYFSPTGQRWGNPLYSWEAMRNDGYTWWIARIKATLNTVDVMRIDHFRGFEAYWQIPASEATAVKGEWIPGPRESFFDAISAALGSSLPIIAEDLGLITPGVVALRDKYNLPGMKVLQFAFHENHDDPFLPHNHIANCVVYTGTHDNNTTIGWWRSGEASRAAKQALTRYVGHKIEHANWDLIRVGMASPAHTLIILFQDIISADQRARMNTPGSASGNWSWRFVPAALEGKSKARLVQWTQFFARGPKR